MNDYKWYFDQPGTQEALIKELKTWEGTPYKHMVGVKQRGCDCIHLVVNTFKNIGANKDRVIRIPKYPSDWHMHTGQALLLDGLEKQYHCERVQVHPSKFKNGDIVLFYWGKQAAHSGIFYNGEIYQALTGLRVEKRVLKDLNFYNRMAYILRLRA